MVPRKLSAKLQKAALLRGAVRGKALAELKAGAVNAEEAYSKLLSRIGDYQVEYEKALGSKNKRAIQLALKKRKEAVVALTNANQERLKLQEVLRKRGLYLQPNSGGSYSVR